MKCYLIICLGWLALVAGCQKSPESDSANFGKFEGEVIASWNDNGRNMTLRETFAYIDSQNRRWVAPAGAVVDGASIPSGFWTILGGPFEGQYRNASVVHDVGCVEMKQPWEDVHRMFYEACRCGGVEESKAKMLYYAVYHFGPRWKTVTDTEVQVQQMADGSHVEQEVEVQRTARIDPPPPTPEEMKQVASFVVEENPAPEEIKSLNRDSLRTRHRRGRGSGSGTEGQPDSGKGWPRPEGQYSGRQNLPRTAEGAYPNGSNPEQVAQVPAQQPPQYQDTNQYQQPNQYQDPNQGPSLDTRQIQQPIQIENQSANHEPQQTPYQEPNQPLYQAELPQDFPQFGNQFPTSDPNASAPQNSGDNTLAQSPPPQTAQPQGEYGSGPATYPQPGDANGGPDLGNPAGAPNQAFGEPSRTLARYYSQGGQGPGENGSGGHHGRGNPLPISAEEQQWAIEQVRQHIELQTGEARQAQYSVQRARGGYRVLVQFMHEDEQGQLVPSAGGNSTVRVSRQGEILEFVSGMETQLR